MFDLMVCDIGLPDGDGCKLYREVVRMGRTPKAIALTGYGMESDIRRCQEAGFHAHVLKPTNIRTLNEVVIEVLSEGRLRGETQPGASTFNPSGYFGS